MKIPGVHSRFLLLGFYFFFSLELSCGGSLVAIASSRMAHRVLEKPLCSLQYISYAFRSLMMRGIGKKKTHKTGFLLMSVL